MERGMRNEPKAQSEQPALDELKDGTWAYLVDVHEPGGRRSASVEDRQAGLNEALAKINKQGGELLQLLEVEGKGKSVPGSINPAQKGYMAIVKK